MPQCKFTSRFQRSFDFEVGNIRGSSATDYLDVKNAANVLNFDGDFWQLVGSGKQDGQQLMRIEQMATKYNLFKISGYKVTCSLNKYTGLRERKPRYSWFLSTGYEEDQAMSGSWNPDDQARPVDYMRNHRRTKMRNTWMKNLYLKNFPWCDVEGQEYISKEFQIANNTSTLTPTLSSDVYRGSPSLEQMLSPDGIVGNTSWNSWYSKEPSVAYSPTSDAASCRTLLTETNWFNSFKNKMPLNTFFYYDYKYDSQAYQTKWSPLTTLNTRMVTDINQRVAKYPRKLYLLPSRSFFRRVNTDNGTDTFKVPSCLVTYTITMFIQFKDPRRFARPATSRFTNSSWLTSTHRRGPKEFGRGSAIEMKDSTGLTTLLQEDSENEPIDCEDSSTLSHPASSFGSMEQLSIAQDPEESLIQPIQPNGAILDQTAKQLQP